MIFTQSELIYYGPFCSWFPDYHSWIYIYVHTYYDFLTLTPLSDFMSITHNTISCLWHPLPFFQLYGYNDISIIHLKFSSFRTKTLFQLFYSFGNRLNWVFPLLHVYIFYSILFSFCSNFLLFKNFSILRLNVWRYVYVSFWINFIY